jgi:hypothetical protein
MKISETALKNHEALFPNEGWLSDKDYISHHEGTKAPSFEAKNLNSFVTLCLVFY